MRMQLFSFCDQKKAEKVNGKSKSKKKKKKQKNFALLIAKSSFFELAMTRYRRRKGSVKFNINVDLRNCESIFFSLYRAATLFRYLRSVSVTRSFLRGHFSAKQMAKKRKKAKKKKKSKN